ncbi:MAG: serine hydrolase domain-containing protein [Bacillota bacterium]
MIRADGYTQLAQRAGEIGFAGVICVTGGHEAVFEYVSGMADRANSRAINRDTLMGIASGTKLLTALAVGQLIDQGLFTLDTRAADIVDPSIADYDRSITIRQLLSHTSGMPDYLDESLLESMDSITLAIPNDRLKGPKDYLPMFPRAPMRFAPGTAFSYNNGGYVYLALIVEQASGLPYGEYINERLLRPIGVTRGGVYATNALPADTAFGYIERGGQWVTNIFDVPIQAGGDGGVLLSAPEMRTIWESFVGGKILSSGLTREFLKPQAAVKPEKGIHYGLGMWLKQTPQGFTPYIQGSDAGISFKSVCSIPDMRIKTAISNTTDGVWELKEAFDAV